MKFYHMNPNGKRGTQEPNGNHAELCLVTTGKCVAIQREIHIIVQKKKKKLCVAKQRENIHMFSNI